MDGSGPLDGGADAVAWDEAREILVVVLLAATVMKLLGPVMAWLQVDDGRFDRDVVTSALTGVNGVSGLMLMGAAVLICTTPQVDVVPVLRTAVLAVAGVTTLLGIVLILSTLTSGSAATGLDAVWDKLRSILSFSAPGTLLAATSAWMARRVVPFPGG